MCLKYILYNVRNYEIVVFVHTDDRPPLNDSELALTIVLAVVVPVVAIIVILVIVVVCITKARG